MKTILSLCVIAPLCFAGLDSTLSEKEKDKKAVIQAGMNYVNALYEVKPELVEESVHPELRKFGFYRANAKDDYREMPMTFEQLVSLCSSWNKDGNRVDENTIKKVELLDLMDTTAVLKVTAAWGIDHMQVGKFDGKWQILNILWQSHPEKKKSSN
ncbi:MAG: nuclear transport factor 2 family protein [Planctomycetota bacterium]